MAYAQQCWSILEQEIQQQRKGRKPKAVELPVMTPQELSVMLGSIPENYNPTKGVRNLIAMSQSPLRVVRSDQGGGGFIHDEQTCIERERFCNFDKP